MAITGTHRELYGRFKFVVNIGGVDSAGFQECSEVAINIEAMEYYEGGVLVPFKEPGLGKVDNVTLQRGMSKDRDLYDWVLDVLDVMSKVPGGTSAPPPTYFRNMNIHQRTRDGQAAIDFPLYWAFPVKWTGGPWNNAESGVTMEQLEVAYHHPDRKQS